MKIDLACKLNVLNKNNYVVTREELEKTLNSQNFIDRINRYDIVVDIGYAHKKDDKYCNPIQGRVGYVESINLNDMNAEIFITNKDLYDLFVIEDNDVALSFNYICTKIHNKIITIDGIAKCNIIHKCDSAY